MAQPHHTSAPPSEPVWDVTFTRVSNAVGPTVNSFLLELVRLFRAVGLGTEQQGGQTPRGTSAFLSVVGSRGLLCIVDITLIDGMAVGQGPRTSLDIRLLDACGEIIVGNIANGLRDWAAPEDLTGRAVQSETLSRAATSVYVSALGHFELLR